MLLISITLSAMGIFGFMLIKQTLLQLNVLMIFITSSPITKILKIITLAPFIKWR